MKNLKASISNFILFLLLCLFVFPADTLASATNTFRSGCFWSYRYVSMTKVTQPGIWNNQSDTDRDCSYAVSVSTIPLCANARAEAGPGVNLLVENVLLSECTAGLGTSDLFNQTVRSVYTDNSPEVLMANEFKHEIEFNKETREVSIHEGRGILKLKKGYPGYVKLEISVGTMIGEIESEQNFTSLYSESIYVSNNGVILSEGLEGNSGIRIRNNDRDIEVVLNGFTKALSVPQTIDFDKEMAVRVSSFAENDLDFVVDKLSDKINSNISIYPNPSLGIINIDFANYEDKNVKVDLFDIAGSRVYSTNKVINKGHASINLNSKIPSGTYYILLTRRKESEFRKIVIK